jgi:hypothetical protein
MIPASHVLFWQYFDFLSVGALVIVIGLLMVLHRIRYGAHESTISKTIAKRKFSRVIFSVAMTCFFPLYYAFLYFWLGPSLHMPLIFYFLLFISAICELIFVWLPSTGKTEKIHNITAGIVGLGMIISMLFILIYGQGLMLSGFIASSCFLLLSIFIAFILYFKKLKNYSLAMELLFCAFYLLTVSIITHG